MKIAINVLLITSILLFNGCTKNVEQQKSELEKEYINHILIRNCQKAQTDFDKMKAIDPDNKFPLLTYKDPDRKKLEEAIEKSSVKTTKAVNNLKEVANQSVFDSRDEFEDNMKVNEASSLLRESVKDTNKVFYENKIPYSYAELESFINACNTNDAAGIPSGNLRKALKMKYALGK